MFNASEDISFFSNNSPPSSPRPCPISPCRNDSMSSLSMENDFFDFNSFVKKDKKPFSPARKKLNMDVHANVNDNSPSSKSASHIIASERLHLQSINYNVSEFGMRISSTGATKRSECSEESQSPIQNKRHKSENQSPASSSIFAIGNQQPSLRKPLSIMNVLTSSSEMLRKNRL